MNKVFALFCFLPLVGCADNPKEESSPPLPTSETLPSSTTDQSEPAEYIAFKDNGNGSFSYYTQTNADIQRLVSDLRATGVADSSLLDPSFWATGECRRMSARDCNKGSCESGRCTLVYSGMSYCRCQ